MYPYIISLYLVTAAIKKFQKKIIPFETRNQPVKNKMLFFSQFDLQLTGGTKCTETFQKNSQMFITSHRLPQRLVACCVGISEIVLFKPKKMFDFTMNSFLDALFITRRPPWATPHSAQHWVSSQYLLSEQRVHGFVHLHHYHLQDLQRITKTFIQTKPP